MSELQIFECAQGTEEWHLARCGVLTASVFDIALSEPSKVRGTPGGMRGKLMRKLIGERLTGKPEEGYKNAAMERGNAMEAEARRAYEFITDERVEQVGFLRRGDVGCSPDSLNGISGMLEIKTKIPSILLEVWESGVMPAEHRHQVQGQLWVAQREWCDFVAYWPGLRPFIQRVYRDEAFIARIKIGVEDFLDEMTAKSARLRELMDV